MAALDWVRGNYVNVFLLLSALLTAGEFIVRLTPTKTDDTLLEKVGWVLKKVMGFLRIPNNIK